MNFATRKGQCLSWLWTLIGLALLFVVGFLMALWMGEEHQLVQQQFDRLPWGWWRGIAYGVLLLTWPSLIRATIKYRRSSYSDQPVKRRSIIILIVLYELLLVQNPLAALFRWAG